LNKYNYIIVGAGIVGLATALTLLKHNPRLKILVLEKEYKLGMHQTGNNSGVIHSGIYYRPGSIKAKNCKRGYKLLLDFCNENNISYDICGKLIIATNKVEEKYLLNIFDRGVQNGLKNLKTIGAGELNEYEPNVVGTKAILVPQTGIIDFKVVIKKYAEAIIKLNSEIRFESEVIDIQELSEDVTVITNNSEFSTDHLISCAGLQSDRLATKTIRNIDLRIIPFRGEYYKLKNESKNLVNNLIYPVPDPSFPFLGVHFTRKINGDIEAGPNAVLAFKREGYNKSSFNFKDAVDTFSWPGFHKIAIKYWKTGLGEFYRSYNKNAFTKALQKLIPSVQSEDLIPGGVGIRAQACDKLGNLLDDFSFERSKRVLHVCNAPSPAATASLAIGEYIAKMFYKN